MTDQQPKDNVVPGAKWEFDASVAKCFDNMLERSIPSYTVMRDLTTRLAVNYLADADNELTSTVVDLGASRGGAISDMLTYPAARKTTFHALEISKPMLAEMYTRFADQPSVNVTEYDLREINKTQPFRSESVNVVLSVLTLQFVPMEHRQRVMQHVYDSLVPGGVFLYVEKILGANYELDELFVRSYYELKAANNYSREDIKRKRASLEGVLVPLTADGNVELMQRSGFSKIDCYFRHLNFAGWIAVK